jgi:hypothetical protein
MYVQSRKVDCIGNKKVIRLCQLGTPKRDDLQLVKQIVELRGISKSCQSPAVNLALRETLKVRFTFLMFCGNKHWWLEFEFSNVEKMNSSLKRCRPYPAYDTLRSTLLAGIRDDSRLKRNMSCVSLIGRKGR